MEMHRRLHLGASRSRAPWTTRAALVWALRRNTATKNLRIQLHRFFLSS